ncbi:FMN-binding protein [Saccharicrinis aurantiacus]|uniref:FMN-binding protein n=1 Tax=Saccharicrinis aurantiacus TaxID=1849719 RepID=UPI0008383A49|nr:FMN-binding protein [Saccharicrinis aurantiacus]
MNLKKLFILLVILNLGISAYCQSDINYRHKSLIKTLQKSGVNNIDNVKELSVADSILKDNTVSGKFYSISQELNSPYKFIYIGRVNSCRAGGCSISSGNLSDESSEYFDYFILFDQDISVKQVKVFNYAATHGQEVTAKGWLKQFVGYNGEVDLKVDKNIDAISGATISVYAITEDVVNKTALLQKVF